MKNKSQPKTKEDLQINIIFLQTTFQSYIAFTMWFFAIFLAQLWLVQSGFYIGSFLETYTNYITIFILFFIIFFGYLSIRDSKRLDNKLKQFISMK
jgi:hypothetical protein